MPTRISTNQLFQGAQDSIGRARAREVEASERASTQRQFVRPSDNPTGWVWSANRKDELAQDDSIAKNATMATQILNATDNVMSQVMDATQRAYELAVQASNDTAQTEQTRNFLLKEVSTLFDGLVRSLNTRFAGKTMFAGYRTDGPAFSSTGEYLGDDGVFRIEVGRHANVPINLQAREVFQGVGNEKTGTDVIGTFRRFMQGLSNSDSETIRSTLPDFMSGINQISGARAQLGARMAEVQKSVDAHEAQRPQTLATIANVEESDSVKAFSDLAAAQTALRAAMSTSQKILTDDPINQLFK